MWDYDTLNFTTNKGNFEIPIEIDMDLVVNIKENNTKNYDVQIYPNPAKDNILLSLNGNDLKNANIIITNIIGNKKLEVENVDLSKKAYTIDISSLANGIYFCHLYENEKPIKTVKFIISK